MQHYKDRFKNDKCAATIRNCLLWNLEVIRNHIQVMLVPMGYRFSEEESLTKPYE